MFEIVKISTYLLKYAHRNIKNNKKIVSSPCQKDITSFKYALDELKSNKEYLDVIKDYFIAIFRCTINKL